LAIETSPDAGAWYLELQNNRCRGVRPLIVAFDDVAPEDLNHHRDPRGSRSSRFSTLRLISMYSMPSAQPPKDVTVAVDVDPYQLF